MAQQQYKVNVRDAQIPMLSEQQTRTIISIPSAEQPTEQDRIGIAYADNVMPTKQGIESVAFRQAIIPASELTPPDIFVDTRIIFGDEATRITIAWDSAGNPYVLFDALGRWLQVLGTIPPVTAPFDSNTITIATINGISYIFYSLLACYIYDESIGELIEVTLIGIDTSVTLGIVGSSGYMVAYTTKAIAWSSTINPLDFVPSQVTGAGGGNVAGTQGDIVFCISNTLGMLVYTFANVIAATYTGNVGFPWKFRPVPDAKGGINLDQVAYEPDTDDIFAYTKAGVQQIGATRSTVILPEVTDFLAGGRFEEYNTTTNEYEITTAPIGDPIPKKIKYIASRYLIISYGVASFTNAVIYDLALNRIGKVKLDHVDVFEYIGGANQTEIAKEQLAFLLADGSVKLMDFKVDAVSNGVLILAKLQATYSRLFTLLEVDTENVLTGATFTVGTLVSLDGKNGTFVGGNVLFTGDNIRKHGFKDCGINHSLVYTGQFNLSTALVTYTINGRR